MNKNPNLFIKLTSLLMFIIAFWLMAISYASGHSFDTFKHPAMFWMKFGFLFNTLVFVSSILYSKRQNNVTRLILRGATIIYLAFIVFSSYKFWKADQLNSMEIGFNSFFLLGTILIIYLTWINPTNEKEQMPGANNGS